MSYLEAREPICSEQNAFVVINSKSKDLGGFSVRRVLPARLARSVGPFVFLDHMGPAEFPPGEGINVLPHPHIGLATVTFLFEGEILHRDSLGYVQPIKPGAVNLMTAGRGIVHSERTSEALLQSGQKLHGMQVWMALPVEQQDIDPEFVHYPAGELPVVETKGVSTTVIIGRYCNTLSPVKVHAETLYLDQQIQAGHSTQLPDAAQRAVYIVDGDISLNNHPVEAGTMAVVAHGAEVTIRAATDSHYMVIGGEAIAPRRMWWNFVHTSAERVEQAKMDWKEGRFDRVPGEDKRIPLPGK